MFLIIFGIYALVANSNKPSIIENTNTVSPKNYQVQGMKVEVVKEGSGAAAKAGDDVTVHYVGTMNGTKFDSSIDRNTPFTFMLGQERVIKGWDLGVVGMKVGEKRKLTIPPDLAYGSAGFLSIPPNATLVFEIEMLKIN